MIQPLKTMSYTYMGRRHTIGVNISQRNAEQVFDNLNSTINLVVGAANTIAGKALYELIKEEMPKYPKLWRQGAKKYGNEAMKAFQTYESIHYTNFGERYGCFIDYLDCIEDAVQEHVDKIYWSAKAVMDKARDPLSEIRAKVETVHALLDIAIRIYDKMLALTKEASGMDFSAVLHAARLDRVFEPYKKFANIVNKRQKGEPQIDLMQDANCNLAIQIILAKLSNEDVLDEAVRKSLEWHPEVKKNFEQGKYGTTERTDA